MNVISNTNCFKLDNFLSRFWGGYHTKIAECDRQYRGLVCVARASLCTALLCSRGGNLGK